MIAARNALGSDPNASLKMRGGQTPTHLYAVNASVHADVEEDA